MASGLALTGCWLLGSLCLLGAQSSDQAPKSRAAADLESAGQKPTGTSTGTPTAGKPAKSKPASAKTMPGITPEREAAVMTFVKQNHPELAELLIHLKEYVPKEYDRAVRDLFRTSERLAQVQERDHDAYELELKLWQARSRAQLLGARLQMADSDELRQQLRATLNEEYDVRLRLLQRDRERATDRVKGLGDQIEKLSQRRGEEIERQLKQWTSVRRGGDVPVKSKAKKKPS